MKDKKRAMGRGLGAILSSESKAFLNPKEYWYKYSLSSLQKPASLPSIFISKL